MLPHAKKPMIAAAAAYLRKGEDLLYFGAAASYSASSDVFILFHAATGGTTDILPSFLA